jgi:hypothetical protein
MHAYQVLTHFFLEYLKLAKMAIVCVLGNVENEHCFSSLTFLKSKLQTTLDPHLPLVGGMYNQKFYNLENFSYIVTFAAWIEAVDCYGVIT